MHDCGGVHKITGVLGPPQGGVKNTLIEALIPRGFDPTYGAMIPMGIDPNGFLAWAIHPNMEPHGIKIQYPYRDQCPVGQCPYRD